MEDFTKSLGRQITLLQMKQIRERKSTCLYKAKKASARSSKSMSFDLRSTARVSPAINSGFVGDRPALVKNEQAAGQSSFVGNETGTSPRQSSLSLFYDLRKKSAQVCPMQDHPSAHDHGSLTSLKQSEESGV